MPEHYDVHRAIERFEHHHKSHEQASDGLTRLMPLAAAVLAVLAGLSSLYAGRLSAQVLALKDEALMQEITSADLWNEYQADSLKAHMYAISAESATASTAAALMKSSKGFRADQPPLSKQAKLDESARDAALAASTAAEGRKSNLEVALAFFEIAIVLTSIAAMTRRSMLLALGCIVGLGGLCFGLLGAFGH